MKSKVAVNKIPLNNFFWSISMNQSNSWKVHNLQNEREAYKNIIFAAHPCVAMKVSPDATGRGISLINSFHKIDRDEMTTPAFNQNHL